MSEETISITDDVPEDWTQGQGMGASAAQEALEHTVSSYLVGVGAILGRLSEDARGLAEDGYTLEDFADLLEGKDIDNEPAEEDDDEDESDSE